MSLNLFLGWAWHRGWTGISRSQDRDEFLGMGWVRPTNPPAPSLLDLEGKAGLPGMGVHVPGVAHRAGPEALCFSRNREQ